MTTPADSLKQICFVVMPFRTKPVRNAKEGAPSEVDFDALWNKAYYPALLDAGYTPVRADLDAGAVIVKDMVERLAYADLVVADVSLPNGNVYYELGLRHAARKTGCVTLSADWSNQLFDIDQFRTARYTLSSSEVTDDEALSIQEDIVKAITTFGQATTPYHVYVETPPEEGWPADKQSVFRSEALKLAEVQGDLRAIRLETDGETRKQLVKNEITKLANTPALSLIPVAVELIYLIRDEIDNGASVIKFIDSLEEHVHKVPLVQEQRLLALGKSGNPAVAAAQLKTLVEMSGPTPERLGLIGGRYKQLWRKAREERLETGNHDPAPEERKNLKRAIDAYNEGMMLDLNEFYCSCNLPPLYLARDQDGDRARADRTDHLVLAACERAISKGEDDEWTRPTLLGAAFRSGDISKAEELADRILEEGPSKWKLDISLTDLRQSLEHLQDEQVRSSLAEVLDRLGSPNVL